MKELSQTHLQPWNNLYKFTSPLFVIVFLHIFLLEVTESGFHVQTLPGFLGDLPFNLETGYIGIGEYDDIQLFYYFVESEGNPKDDPLILFLIGGPGCSGRILTEIGVLNFNIEKSTVDKPVLELNPYRWTKVASVIFIDQPAGGGFSYGKTPDAYVTNDTLSTKYIYYFLKRWFMDHPKFLANPLYLGGDSYAGIQLPMIVQKIYKGNEVGEEPHMNIKGYVLDNPLTDTHADFNTRIAFAHRKALLSDEIYKSVEENCHGEYLNVDLDNTPCIRDLEVISKCLERITTRNILLPYCGETSIFKRSLSSLNTGSIDISALPEVQIQDCKVNSDFYQEVWSNRRDVREALHIHEVFNKTMWLRCNQTLHFYLHEKPISYKHNIWSTVSYHQHLSQKNCRALIYSGDHDMTFTYMSTLKWIESLNLPVVIDWTPWFVEEQVAGYTIKYSNRGYNLTFATVKGAGHVVSETHAKENFNMLIRWLANDTL